MRVRRRGKGERETKWGTEGRERRGKGVEKREKGGEWEGEKTGCDNSGISQNDGV